MTESNDRLINGIHGQMDGLRRSVRLSFTCADVARDQRRTGSIASHLVGKFTSIPGRLARLPSRIPIRDESVHRTCSNAPSARRCSPRRARSLLLGDRRR